MISQKEIDRRFDLHSPDEDQGVRMDSIRAEIKQLAEYIVENTPVSREQSLALTKLEEVTFNAIGSIAREK